LSTFADHAGSSVTLELTESGPEQPLAATQTPPEQDWFAAHAVAQFPQWFLSFVRFASQPSAATALQLS
jgi:hypothetical protein